MTHFLKSNIDKAMITHLYVNYKYPSKHKSSFTNFDINGPTTRCLSTFLTDTGYKDIVSSSSTPFQKAFNTNPTCLEWLSQFPRLFSAVQTVMTAFGKSSSRIEGSKHRMTPLHLILTLMVKSNKGRPLSMSAGEMDINARAYGINIPL